MSRNQNLLNWLESQKRKDDIEEKIHKDRVIQEIKKLNKTDLFQKQIKISLWRKIKIILFGN